MGCPIVVDSELFFFFAMQQLLLLQNLPQHAAIADFQAGTCNNSVLPPTSENLILQLAMIGF